MWICFRSTSSEVAVSGRCRLCFNSFFFSLSLCSGVCNICTLSRGDVLFSSWGRLRGSHLDPRSVRFLTRRTRVLCFLTCNISQVSPSFSRPRFFLFEYAFAAPTKLCYPRAGGIVFEVAFGGVSDGMGTGCIECARAAPVIYCHDRSLSPLDAA
jgi:hypothetical protein